MNRRAGSRSDVRILGGRWKGRKLGVPRAARPTSGRARQALFNLLGERVSGARVLDLYAGTGAVGLEAVSRGAASAVLVEADAEALRQTLEGWDMDSTEVRVVEGSAARALAQLAAEGERFDFVFADPPYAQPGEGASELLGLARILAEEGIVVLQRDSKSPPPGLPGLRSLSQRAYGRNVFHFLGVL